MHQYGRAHACREHAIPLEHVATRVKLERPDSERVVFTYALELGGPLSGEQRQQLEHVANACPVRQTLSKRLEFHAVL